MARRASSRSRPGSGSSSRAARQARPERLRPIVLAGALVQVTAASLDGRIGRRARDTGFELVEAGLAHLIASDAHTPDVRGIGMSEAAIAVGDEALAGWLTLGVPAAIVDGGPFSAQPARQPCRPGCSRRAQRSSSTRRSTRLIRSPESCRARRAPGLPADLAGRPDGRQRDRRGGGQRSRGARRGPCPRAGRPAGSRVLASRGQALNGILIVVVLPLGSRAVIRTR